MLVFVGIIATSSSLNELTIFDGYLVVSNGKIVKKGTTDEFTTLAETGAFLKHDIIQLGVGQFLMPGFIDCHTHAPQFPNIGQGLNCTLLEWLNKYTFPLERQYENVEFASKVYNQVVQRLLTNGTTTACYFGSLHLSGTMELVKTVIMKKQRALVGKVSMDIGTDKYFNTIEKELLEAETFVRTVSEFKNDLVLPIVTPRFAPSCSRELMTGLSNIAQKYGCRIQSHISENAKEIEHVLATNPDCRSYSEVYEKCNILNENCIMAHAVHLSDAEIALLVERGVSVAHCPASNTRLRSGICPVRKLLEKKLKVGLGTDVSGGDSAIMLDAMRRAMDVSTYLDMNGSGDCKSSLLDWREVFYLATLGGAEALNLEHKTGSFEVGKEFDALLVDVYAPGGPIDRYDHAATAQNLLEQFIYLGDDRNIAQVYVKGEKVKG